MPLEGGGNGNGFNCTKEEQSDPECEAILVIRTYIAYVEVMKMKAKHLLLERALKEELEIWTENGIHRIANQRGL